MCEEKEEEMKRLLYIFVFIGLTSCNYGKLIGTAYLVSIDTGSLPMIYIVTSPAQADSVIAEYGLKYDSESMIGNHKHFFETSNGDVNIYVEKKGVYLKNNKERIRIYK